MKDKFTHPEDIYNLSAPREIVPEIIRLLNPKSVIDIGCGLGTFLYCFKQAGISDVLGIDGPWVKKELLNKYLAESEFLERDLAKELKLERKFDLALSLEVGEHLPEESADIFVRNLISAGNIILFSAAIPFQIGQDHINEQWPSYWEEKFLKHGYVIHDIFRPMFWDNPKVFWWYKQNMVLFTPKEFKFNSDLIYNPLRNVVHYELYMSKLNTILEMTNGEIKSKYYIRFLIKSIIRNNYFLRKIKRMLTRNKPD